MLFAAIQAAVICADRARRVHRIGSHVLLDHGLWAIAVFATLGYLAGVHFGVCCSAEAAVYSLARRAPPSSHRALVRRIDCSDGVVRRRDRAALVVEIAG